MTTLHVDSCRDVQSLGTKVPKMALDRPRRANAGRYISRLIDQEQETDEFYQTAYGGFDEASGDEEYEVGFNLDHTY